jgi:hypothetical protein
LEKITMNMNSRFSVLPAILLLSAFGLGGCAGMTTQEKGTATGAVIGGVAGNVLTLKLKAPATAKTITYITDKKWDPKTLLYGKNGIAALTFCEVPLETAAAGK